MGEGSGGIDRTKSQKHQKKEPRGKREKKQPTGKRKRERVTGLERGEIKGGGRNKKKGEGRAQ